MLCEIVLLIQSQSKTSYLITDVRKFPLFKDLVFSCGSERKRFIIRGSTGSLMAEKSPQAEWPLMFITVLQDRDSRHPTPDWDQAASSLFYFLSAPLSQSRSRWFLKYSAEIKPFSSFFLEIKIRSNFNKLCYIIKGTMCSPVKGAQLSYVSIKC